MMKSAIKAIAISAGLKTFVTWLGRWRWMRKVGGVRRLPSGIECTINTFDDWLIFHEIHELRVYDSALNEVVNRAPAGDHVRVLDLGGNVGFFALAMIDKWIRDGRDPKLLHLISVEASPLNCERMKAHQQTNAGLGVDWQIAHGLAGKRTGSAVVACPEGHYSFRVECKPAVGGFNVEYINLDPIVDSWLAVDLLKCDIEGSELDFLRNYPNLLSKCITVCMEVHGLLLFGPVDDILAAAGFGNLCVLSAEDSSGPSGRTKTILVSRSTG